MRKTSERQSGSSSSSHYESCTPVRLVEEVLKWPIAAVKAHYWLGVAYEELGEKQKAYREYETFLEIWKNADFESIELKDARARLTRLAVQE